MRPVICNAEAVDPVLPDRLIVRIVIGVALEIINQQVITDCEIPDGAFKRTSVINLIHAPVVRGIRFEQSGIVAFVQGFGAGQAWLRYREDGVVYRGDVAIFGLYLRDYFRTFRAFRSFAKPTFALVDGREL